jgi:hypothetical protein
MAQKTEKTSGYEKAKGLVVNFAVNAAKNICAADDVFKQSHPNQGEFETPKRIQRKRTKGWKMPANTVYVGRDSKWGNPFSVERLMKLWDWDKHTAQLEAVDLFRECLIDGDEPCCPEQAACIARIRRDIAELKGRNLACWCGPDQPCHADVLLELANKESEQ